MRHSTEIHGRLFLLVLAAAVLLTCPAARSAEIRTIAGTGKPGYSGDGGPGVSGELNNPYGLTIGPDGALYFCEVDNNVVRRLDLQTNRLSTVAGNGRKGYSGDGGPALAASLNQPYEVRFDHAGNMLFAEMQNHRIRRVNLQTGVIETFAGTGERKPTPDGASLDGAPLNGPRAMAFDRNGDMFLVLREGNAVYRIDMRHRVIHHLAGTGAQGYSGDGGPAR